MSTETKQITAKVRRFSKAPHDCEIFMGGDPDNPTWEEYVASYKPEWQPRVEAVGEAMQEFGLVPSTGGAMANDTWFELSDGTSIALSWRAWGDFIQALVSKREGYMRYYM